jgi:hypothetical protein
MYKVERQCEERLGLIAYFKPSPVAENISTTR